MWADEYSYNYDHAAGPLSLRPIPLSARFCRQQAERFLQAQGLTMPQVDYLAGIFDDDDRLLACGGLDGALIKGLAVSEEARDLHLAARLVTHLRAHALEAGHVHVRVFTKPCYIPLFRNMGFSLIGQSRGAALLDTDRHALERYLVPLRSLAPDEGRIGTVVMNANPLTKGHRYLLEQAAAQCDFLVVIPVGENPHNLFSYAERSEMLQAALATLPRTALAPASIYAVSASTFPTYFIKEHSARSEAHIELDLDIFARHIAPALRATVRFVGSEPADPLTAAYNAAMHRLLPPAGIEVVEIERCAPGAGDSRPISASRLRDHLLHGRTAEALRLAAPEAVPAVLAEAAATALRTELDLTPKPGLVDRDNAGAHTDMDYALMAGSIRALRPAFLAVARACHRADAPDPARLRQFGLEGEQRMLRVTGGVNTHRGALFALGLTLAAAAHLYYKEQAIRPEALRAAIADLAAGFVQPAGTHGARVREAYQVGGALGNALGGYAPLFDEWLPFLEQNAGSPHALHRLLLLIVSRLDDTNLLHRGGAARAARARAEAAEVLAHFSPEALRALDARFTAENLSPGGAADMLSLTFLIRGLVSSPKS
ncbi:MAG: triphosphoribosyl-dephospho-CoA synthase [Alloprevotella sp.]|nr:triphosphoribosyl-dephospho-CoA synthase [Alloprevotella sp.]